MKTLEQLIEERDNLILDIQELDERIDEVECYIDILECKKDIKQNLIDELNRQIADKNKIPYIPRIRKCKF